MDELDDFTLVMQGKAGDKEAVNALWERHQKLIQMLMRRIYKKNKSFADHVGIDLDDLFVESWFSVCDAVRRYNPDKRTAFTTVLGWSVRNTATKLLRSDHFRTVTNEDGKQVQIPADPLNYAVSSDIPLDTESDSTLCDVIEDPSVNVEIDFENEQVRRAVDFALYSLSTRHRQLLQMRFRDGYTLQACADQMNISRQGVHCMEKVALKRFREALDMRAILP